MSLRPALRRTAAEEGGMALAEVLVGMALAIGVLFALLGLMDTTAKIAPRDQERAHAIRDAQVGLHRLTRELRQAYKVQAITDYSVDFLVGNGSHVRYECDVPYPEDDPANPYDQDYRQCKRVQAPVGQSLPAIASGETVVERVLNPSTQTKVFNNSTGGVSPRFIRVRVDVPARGERTEERNRHSVVLDDGVYMRNLALGG